MKTFQIFLFPLLVTGCGGADRIASYNDTKSGTSISIELTATHPFLAEYSRELVVRTAADVVNRAKLFPDSGGYAAANLYRCGEGTFLVEGFSDQVLVDPISGSMKSGTCKKEAAYIGIFDGAGSSPWRFYPAIEQTERKLEMLGG